jgi:Mg/Co/Ni transporter MgtE
LESRVLDAYGPRDQEVPSMRPHQRWHRRTAWLWAGLLTAWLSAGVVEYLRVDERFTPAILITTVITLLVGALGTARLRSQDNEPFISVEDLRR